MSFVKINSCGKFIIDHASAGHTFNRWATEQHSSLARQPDARNPTEASNASITL
jgi:hypothetical protein